MEKRVTSGVRRRVPVVNGIFYPNNREILTNQLVSWGLKEGSKAPSPPGGQVLIAPHGAWDISGRIAGAAFASLQLTETLVRGIRRVILLGPCYSFDEEGIYLSESDFFETPLGDLPVDLNLTRKLASCSTVIKVNDIPHLSEHSLEVLLPFVKYCLGEVKIVPILVSGNRPVLISGLARALRIILENYMEESLIVISSNVSRSLEPGLALSMAEEFRSVVSSMDTGGFLARFAEGRISACGGVPVGGLLESGLLDGKRFSALTPLAHGTGEDGQAVYYGAFACS